MNQFLGLIIATLVTGLAPMKCFANPADSEMTLKQSPCKDDIGKLCSVVKPGDGRIQECLSEKSAQLSDSCKKYREINVPVSKEVRKACGPDVKTLCSETRPGRGRFLKCLKENEAKASAPCREALKKMVSK
ncbi:MAG: cysteine rich repeat-containing protein [Bdellovibrionales bacterium]|nr:cysteine rich repeat-containing protein [Bdellovibrionales bacterium]